MTIFPFIQPEITVTVEPLPMAREVAWDFDRDLPVLKNGEPVFCGTGTKSLVGIMDANWKHSSASSTAPLPKRRRLSGTLERRCLQTRTLPR